MLPFGLQKGIMRFDSAQSDQVKEKLSAVDYRALVADISNLRGWALGIALDLIEAVNNNQLDDATPTDYLDSLISDVLGSDDDDADNSLDDILAASIADAFTALGVDSGVVEDMFSDDLEVADAAIEAASEVAMQNLPDEGEPLDQFYNDFVFGFDEQDLLDGETEEYDGLRFQGQRMTRKVNGKKIKYQVARAIRGGKLAFVAKRQKSQKIRLTAAQRQGLKKANMKNQTANAIRKRMKSFRKGKKMGLY